MHHFFLYSQPLAITHLKENQALDSYYGRFPSSICQALVITMGFTLHDLALYLRYQLTVIET